ncbi:MAG TPA: diguanylate cyclase [bacterium]|nr:diguanylate cyclase [bacterium]
MAVTAIPVRASTADSGRLRPPPEGRRRLARARRPAAPAIAVAAAAILLLCTALAQASTFATVTFRLGAFMAGAVLLSVVLGMVVQERRTTAHRAWWNLELDRRLGEATRELRVRVEELTASAAAGRAVRVVEAAAGAGPPHRAGESGGIRLGPSDAGTSSARAGPARELLPSPPLREEVQRVIRMYPLPVLYPWAQFERFVGDEIERCRSLLIVFSIIGIRMEDYATARTETPDRDLALRRAVDLLQASLRRIDILSYDGAGRFAVLLPQVPKVHALEKARELIARLETDGAAAGLLRRERLTLAAGVVTFPQDGARAVELLSGIEAALIRTGRAGRPRGR